MIRWMIGRRLSAAEREVGAPLDYLRHMLRYSVGALKAFAKIMPAAQYRKVLPPAPFHVARLVTARFEDCGSCVQPTVNLAKKDLVPTRVIEAVLADRPADLPEECAEAYHFADSVVRQAGDEAAWRDRVRKRYGEAGVVELALAVAVARTFATLKRGLGHAKSCSLVTIET